MTLLIGYIIIVSGAAAWLLTLAHKWRVVEWLAVHSNAFFNKMFNCDFCLSWWTAWLLTAVLLCVTGDIRALIVPFVSTSITRRLL